MKVSSLYISQVKRKCGLEVSDSYNIYTRVSTLIQVDGFSLDALEEEIRAFAKQRDVNIVSKYSVEGKSGKNAEHRPAFNGMMADIRSKKDNIKYVIKMEAHLCLILDWK